ncbi:MAG: 4Fe-4S dicluster domain-containing protein [Deltaproteobacteria bacterium]|nr:4Fe-4S dicluster domain-containing protein [Deltaproteobacteria bacterium]MBW2024545.1 4Fe-4S dicluster domain-containing protein [Deltaproteobacteria bacterium]MBW2124742.1 4Fe-4S dicluster domain-containing protein [Deltaproteobacteria bacterium]
MSNAIVDKIREAGVVGAGGAGFPTHIKVSARAEIVLGNGASCEPLLVSDIYLMEEMSEQILRGLQLVVQCTGAKKGILCLKGKHKKAWENLQRALKQHFPEIELFELGNFYPAGDEHILVYEVTGKVVPEGGIPHDVGVIVNNVETLLNIERAVDEGAPVTQRYITVTGEIKHSMVTKIPIGTPIGQVIDYAGGATVEDFLVVVGGPMMGMVTDDLSVPATKTTTALIVLPKNHNVVRSKIMDPRRLLEITKTVCCQCSRCTDLCPRHLLGHDIEPHKIMRSLAWASDLSMEVFQATLICSECGICEKYACPMMISPREVNARIKQELLRKGVKKKQDGKAYEPSSFRNLRKVPADRLIEKLNIKKYDYFPPFRYFSSDVNRVKIPLDQHIGKPAVALVAEGDKITRGGLIGDIGENAVGAKVHSSINGVVVSARDAITIQAGT